MEDFKACASTTARTLIHEMFLPAHVARTVGGGAFGGVAGGEKFMCDGVFFKLVRQSALYGSYELAAAATAHEVRSLRVYLDADPRGLTTALCCYVDYLGYAWCGARVHAVVALFRRHPVPACHAIPLPAP